MAADSNLPRRTLETQLSRAVIEAFAARTMAEKVARMICRISASHLAGFSQPGVRIGFAACLREIRLKRPADKGLP